MPEPAVAGISDLVFGDDEALYVAYAVGSGDIAPELGWFLSRIPPR